jgi:hypothetical protein
MKYWEILEYAQLAASQEGLSSMELVPLRNNNPVILPEGGDWSSVEV